MANIAYLRVSTKDQSLDRQRDALKALDVEFDPRFIFEDMQSGKDFNRDNYQVMKKVIRRGDVLYIKELDRLGRDSREMRNEWEYITKTIGAEIVVMDEPLLDTRQNKIGTQSLIADLVLVILSYKAEEDRLKIKQRQREGINAALLRGKHLGRPKKDISEKAFRVVAEQVKKGVMTATSGWKKLEISKSTFYRLAKEYGYKFDNSFPGSTGSTVRQPKLKN